MSHFEGFLGGGVWTVGFSFFLRISEGIFLEGWGFYLFFSRGFSFLFFPFVFF